jgi:tetratricopeptide (TPR) repeat protein
MVKDSAQNQNSSEDRRLDSWKEIAAFFGRDERTVKRWEKERGLPVHRVPGGGRGTVFAFAEELKSWLRSSQIKQNPDELSKDETSTPPSPEQVFVQNVPARHWGIIGAAICLAVLFAIAFGFTRFYKLHSVHGHLLPRVTPLVGVEEHRKAEDLYLQGRYHWNKRTPEDLAVAVDDFAKSSRIDPNYALAYAGTADCYNLLREYTATPASQAFPLAIAAANKSLELDPNLSEGHRALAFALFNWNWDVRGGEREFQKAIELNPKDVEAHHWYATTLMTLTRYPEAIEQIELARQLDPTSSSIAADRAMILYGSGRTKEAVEILKELEIAEPKFYSPPIYLSRIYFENKEYEEYFDEAIIAASLSNDQRTLASIEASRKRFKEGGEQAMLEGSLQEQLEAFRQGRGNAISVAMYYAMLGKKKEAMEYLEKAYQRHDYELISLGDAFAFRGMHDGPQFQALLKKVYATEQITGTV